MLETSDFCKSLVARWCAAGLTPDGRDLAPIPPARRPDEILTSYARERARVLASRGLVRLTASAPLPLLRDGLKARTLTAHAGLELIHDLDIEIWVPPERRVLALAIGREGWEPDEARLRATNPAGSLTFDSVLERDLTKLVDALDEDDAGTTTLLAVASLLLTSDVAGQHFENQWFDPVAGPLRNAIAAYGREKDLGLRSPIFSPGSQAHRAGQRPASKADLTPEALGLWGPLNL